MLPPLTTPYDTVLGFHGTGKVAYLTFDYGPTRYTGQLLDILAAAGVKATFCQIGSQLAGFPEVERRLIADGHTLRNHSWTHPPNGTTPQTPDRPDPGMTPRRQTPPTPRARQHTRFQLGFHNRSRRRYRHHRCLRAPSHGPPATCLPGPQAREGRCPSTTGLDHKGLESQSADEV